MFQFLIGAMKGADIKPITLRPTKFQFLIGAMKVSIRLIAGGLII